MPMSRWIAEWNPEDPSFWESTGKRIARRNLIWSIIAENIGFSVWLLLSAVACLGGAKCVYLANAGLMWIPLIVIAAIGAWAYMDNLTSARSNFRDQITVAKRKHTWVIAWLYIGTFGSFVGYSAAFPLLLK